MGRRPGGSHCSPVHVVNSALWFAPVCGGPSFESVCGRRPTGWGVRLTPHVERVHSSRACVRRWGHKMPVTPPSKAEGRILFLCLLYTAGSFFIAIFKDGVDVGPPVGTLAIGHMGAGVSSARLVRPRLTFYSQAEAPFDFVQGDAVGLDEGAIGVSLGETSNHQARGLPIGRRWRLHECLSDTLSSLDAQVQGDATAGSRLGLGHGGRWLRTSELLHNCILEGLNAHVVEEEWPEVRPRVLRLLAGKSLFVRAASSLAGRGPMTRPKAVHLGGAFNAGGVKATRHRREMRLGTPLFGLETGQTLGVRHAIATVGLGSPLGVQRRPARKSCSMGAGAWALVGQKRWRVRTEDGTARCCHVGISSSRA